MTKLWEKLDDSMIFAVTLPNGDLGYCCVMGQNGEHFSLTLYRNATGFSSYLRSVNPSAIQSSTDMFSLFTSMEQISCDFENLSDLDYNAAEKEEIKTVAAQNGLKIPRSKGWPSFLQYDAGKIITPPGESETNDMLEALSAALDVARIAAEASPEEMAKLGFDSFGDYPSVKGGKLIPLLTRQKDGTYKWDKTPTPAYKDIEYPRVTFNDKKLAERLKALSHSATYQCRLVSVPSPIREGNVTIYPSVLLLVRKTDGYAIPLFNEGSDTDLLNQLAEIFTKIGACAAVIELNDKRTSALLTDFCKKAGISIYWQDSTPELDDAVAYFFSMMSAL